MVVHRCRVLGRRNSLPDRVSGSSGIIIVQDSRRRWTEDDCGPGKAEPRYTSSCQHDTSHKLASRMDPLRERMKIRSGSWETGNEEQTFPSASRSVILLLISLTVLLLLGSLRLLLLLLTLLLLVGDGLEVVKLGLFGRHRRRCRSGTTASLLGLVRTLSDLTHSRTVTMDSPPVPFADFEFNFDPVLHHLFPSPPPLPPAADLFTQSETTDILGFLDNFNWEFDESEQATTATEDGVTSIAPANTINIGANLLNNFNPLPHPPLIPPPLPTTATTAATSPATTKQNGNSIGKSTTSRPKGQLSAPQKRLNHIMSEQKRRNAIRDGYVQLTALLAPAGAPPGTGMPTRGRPKGSGNRGKGKCQGKSGILFRAVDYCRFMEENIQVLRDEVAKVEAAVAESHQTPA